MTRLELAKAELKEHSICVAGEGVTVSDGRGIAPVLALLEHDGLRERAVADKIVGKAAALLFVYGGVEAVYAHTLSEGGRAVLEEYGIPYEYGTLTQKIINRAGTDICPMERTVLEISDPHEAYLALKAKVALLSPAE